MEKVVKEELEYVEDEDTVFWDIVSLFDNKVDAAILKKIFPDEAQFCFMKALVKKLESAYDFHDGKDSESHLDIRGEIRKLKQKLQDHRHNFSERYSGKAEV